MELKQNEINTDETPLMGQAEFARKYGNGMTTPGVRYLMDKGKIDFTIIGQTRYVVLTSKTKQYEPRTDAGEERGPYLSRMSTGDDDE